MDMNRQFHAPNVGLRDIGRRKILERKLCGIHISLRILGKREFSCPCKQPNPRFAHGTKTHTRTSRIFKMGSKHFLVWCIFKESIMQGIPTTILCRCQEVWEP